MRLFLFSFLKNLSIMPHIIIIVAVAENNAIGNKNELLYHLKADLKHFKALTTGHTVIMGHNTYRSLPKGALPNRRNVVLSRNTNLSLPSCEVFSSLERALLSCEEDEMVFVIGGAMLYAEAMPYAERLYVTHIDAVPCEADAFFPKIDRSRWAVENEESHEADEQNERSFRFVTYTRR